MHLEKPNFIDILYTSTDLAQDYSGRREEGMNEIRTDEQVHNTNEISAPFSEGGAEPHLTLFYLSSGNASHINFATISWFLDCYFGSS